MANESPKFRRLRQFSLRTILIFTTLCAVIIGPWMHGVRRQRLAVKQIEALGGRVGYQTRWPFTLLPESTLEKISIDYSASVVDVFLSYRTVDRKMVRHTSDELDQAIAAMDQLPRLRKLSLHTLHLQSDDLARFRSLSDQVETLAINELFHGDLKATSLQHLSGWPKLNQLSLLSGTLGAEGFDSLAKIPKLKSLSLGCGTLDVPALTQIARAKSLQELTFFQCRFEGESLTELRKLPNLSRVSLQNMHAEVHYEGYTIDQDGRRKIIGGPLFRFERSGDAADLLPPTDPFGNPFPQAAYEQWLEEALPGVEIGMMHNS